MDHQRRARLGGDCGVLAWLVDPTTDIPRDARPLLYGALLAAPGVVVIGVLSSLLITVAAAIRTGLTQFWIFAAIDITLLLLRLRAVRRCQRHFRAGTLPTIDRSVLLTIGWCALQGIVAFAIGLTGDLPTIVITTAFILGLVAPICARNHTAPRLAVTLVLLCDVPFKIGLALSGHPILWILIPLSVPLLASVRVLLRNFTTILAASLNAAERNRLLAGHDPLTGLANRYDLDAQLARLTASPEHPLALLCLDLDRFKPINDRFGHAAGDAVLVGVAERLHAVAGEHALIVRLGGDEFLLALPGLSPGQAQSLAEGLARTISGSSYPIDSGETITVGVSIGYACFPDDATSLSVLRNRADDALYSAKRGGGVRRYDPQAALTHVA
ncbi:MULTISPECIES: GGDEF domain-containing protein [unclassified Sphingomonas]|uniref:GGDEF domain-containing protein n=1 Tax=unclassified Sphingomonas TaxID=196159 RepID=UPI0009E87F5B|nr:MULTISPECIES: GGDEF domain-containing protein [unclassified Sphingomonas]